MHEYLRNTGFATRAIRLAKPENASSHAITMGVTNEGAYARQSNPIVNALETAIAALEGGVGAMSTASGMAAVSQTLLALLPPGGRLITHRCLYDWSTILRAEVLPQAPAEIVTMDLRCLSDLERSLQTPTAAVYLESLSNPILDVLDLDAIVRLAHEAGALVIVDNTFLSPYLLRPLERGADVVLHAATKYLAGHGDVLAGVVTAREDEVLERLKRARSIYGGVLAPTSAFLVLRGLATLPIRMERHCANAQRVAAFLAQQPQVGRVRRHGGLYFARGAEGRRASGGRLAHLPPVGELGRRGNAHHGAGRRHSPGYHRRVLASLGGPGGQRRPDRGLSASVSPALERTRALLLG